MIRRIPVCAAVLAVLILSSVQLRAQGIGSERALPNALPAGAEFSMSLRDLIERGAKIFSANWTIEDGQGRPLTKGTGAPISDPNAPLVFPRNMNRVSAMDSNSCAGCHNGPRPGGSGDFATNVVVLGQRFDFATFDGNDSLSMRGTMNEVGAPETLDTIGNSRQTVGMFGSGYVEMLARQITADLQTLRDGLAPGASVALVSKGISFGQLTRDAAGNWDVSLVEGLPAPSIASSGPTDPPNLIIRPFHQAGAVISLRQFTNNAMNHHHGIQTVERFGAGMDPDGDGVIDELGIADVTAVTAFQATLEVPGRVIPSNPSLRWAVAQGQNHFVSIGCSGCHVPSLPLDNQGWIYSEPNPYNPAGNLSVGDSYESTWGSLTINLNSNRLPQPRLEEKRGKVIVPVFSDFKLHDITSGPNDPNRESLDMHAPAGSTAFFAGNARFLSSRLWGVANQMPHFHHGKFSTLRQAIEAHAGEASGVMANWAALSTGQKNELIEFLKSLQILPEGTKELIVDEKGRRVRFWPDLPWTCGQPVPALP
ncbi:MAG: thiol oxidoreductase [Planctomycetes bacterium]|nr:thiol oxidoreductase [Planctomycetota bacterium]